MALYRCGSSGGTETVLWTNNRPTSSFSPQTVTLSDDISNYKYLKFTFYAYTNNTNLSTSMISVDEFKKLTGSKTAYAFQYFCSPVAYWDNRNYTKFVRYSSDNTVYFGNTYRINDTESLNTFAIPYQIIGIK